MANREKPKIAATRLTEQEYQALEEIAAQKGVSVSMIIYDCLSKLIGGEIKASIGIVTEQILHDHLEHLKEELLEELKQQQPEKEQPKISLPKEDGGEKRQPSKAIIPSDQSSLSARALSKRLGVGRTTLTRWKDKGNDYLAERTRERDPEGKAWVFDEQTKMYVEANGI